MVANNPVRIIVHEHFGRNIAKEVYDKLPTFLKQQGDDSLHVAHRDSASSVGERTVLRNDSGSVEIFPVPNLIDIADMMKAHDPPYYGLVIFNLRDTGASVGHGIRTTSIAGEISSIDPYLPKFLFMNATNLNLVDGFLNAGIDTLVDSNNLANRLKYAFVRSPALANLHVVKMGGSATDFDRDNPKAYDLEHRLADILRVKNEHDGYLGLQSQRTKLRIVLTAGGGQYGDYAKFINDKYGQRQRRVAHNFPRHIAQALQLNLETFRGFAETDGSLIKPGAEYKLTSNNSADTLYFMCMPPHYISARDSIPLNDSDTHTVALAEWAANPRSKTVITLIKRTDGVYTQNPYFGYEKRNGVVLWDQWRDAQRGNQLLPHVSVDDLLHGSITRIGQDEYGRSDGSTGHLMEDSALAYLGERSQNISKVLVTHVAPWEMWQPLGGSEFRHVVTDEVRDIGPYMLHGLNSGMWQSVGNDMYREVGSGNMINGVEHAWRAIAFRSMEDALLSNAAQSEIVVSK